MVYNFVIRIHKDDCRNPVLSDLKEITISGITLLSKHNKIGDVCEHSGNKKKFKYFLKLSKKFNLVSGSHSYPNLSFKGEYIDIEVFNFPRFPAFYQDYSAAKNCLNGYGYTNYLNLGFPHQLLYRKIEILNLKTQNHENTHN
jgi:hypothetical protein